MMKKMISGTDFNLATIRCNISRDCSLISNVCLISLVRCKQVLSIQLFDPAKEVDALKY